MKLLNAQEVTGLVESTIQAGLTAQDKVAEAELKKKAPGIGLRKVGIPPESFLLFQDGVTTIQVLTNRKVEFDGQARFLVTPTRKLLGLSEDYPIHILSRMVLTLFSIFFVIISAWESFISFFNSIWRVMLSSSFILLTDIL